MGCDIHATIEHRRRSDRYTSDWFAALSNVHIERRYSLFARMAGVRGDEKPIAEPRGVPPDASGNHCEMVERWDADGHSHSWLTMEEVDAIGPDDGAGYLSTLMHAVADEIQGCDVRICFFFDN